MQQKIILATKSPYRREMMKYTGFDFITDSADIDEYHSARPSDPKELVLHLSKLKAEAVARKHKDAIVIGFDSVGCFNGKILEKSKDYKESFERLKSLSNNSQQYMSGITVINTATKKVLQDLSVAEIKYRQISDEEIRKLLDEDTEEIYKTSALGYNPFNKRAISFMKEISGDINDVLSGFPVAKVINIIKEAMK